MSEYRGNSNYSTTRLENLADGIFAFAMTLLIFNFGFLDSFKSVAEVSFKSIFADQSGAYLSYFISFAFLAIFWIIDVHTFHRIKKTDRPHIWLNIIMLMFIVFIPYTTSLVNRFPDQPVSEFTFAANIFIITMLFEVAQLYAGRERHLFKEDICDEEIRTGLLRGLVMPIIAGTSMVMAFVYPTACSYIYIITPFILALPVMRFREK